MDRNRRTVMTGLAVALSWPTAARTAAGAAAAAAAVAAGEAPTTKSAAAPEASIELSARPDKAGSGTARSALEYGGLSPGSVLRIKHGSTARLRLTSSLGEPTSLDFHGMRLGGAVAGLGGLAGTAVGPGGAATVSLAAPDAGTFWFHPGLLPGVVDQTARGLAGVLIVEEQAPPAVDHDKVLVFTDRPAEASDPVQGTAAADAPGLLRANRNVLPDRDRVAPGSRIRLRVVNASTRWALGVSCEGARPSVAAIDGQPSELFEPLRDRVPIGPGARFDLLFDMPGEAGADVAFIVRGPGAGAPSAALVLRTDGAKGDGRPPITALPPNPLLPRVIALEKSTRAAVVAEARVGVNPGGRLAWRVNGAAASAVLPGKPLFAVKRNSPVTLAFKNAGPVLTAFRLHGHAMRLLHPLDDGWEPYWRDSVLVPPGVTHHAAFLADNPGRWLIESPFADQAEAGLRTWFEVL